MDYTLLVAGLICAGAGLLTGFFIGRETGRKSLLPLLDETRRLQELADAPPETPQYTNYPGTSGRFLGRFHSTIGNGYDYDLYFDTQSPQVVFARYGDENSDFIMANLDEAADSSEPLAEAFRRVVNGGLHCAGA